MKGTIGHNPPTKDYDLKASKYLQSFRWLKHHTVFLHACGWNHDIEPGLEGRTCSASYVLIAHSATVNSAIVLQTDELPLVTLCMQFLRDYRACLVLQLLEQAVLHVMQLCKRTWSNFRDL